jgi:uncharacterized membrane protein
MDSKTTAWVSYLTIVGWVVSLLQYNNMSVKSSLVLFHIRQMFGLMLLFVATQLLTIVMVYVPGFYTITWVLYVGLFVLWLMGILAALNEEEKPIPIIGVLFQQWFQFLK